MLDMPELDVRGPQLPPEEGCTTIGNALYEGFWASSVAVGEVVDDDRIADNPINRVDPSGLRINYVDDGPLSVSATLIKIHQADAMVTRALNAAKSQLPQYDALWAGGIAGPGPVTTGINPPLYMYTAAYSDLVRNIGKMLSVTTDVGLTLHYVCPGSKDDWSSWWDAGNVNTYTIRNDNDRIIHAKKSFLDESTEEMARSLIHELSHNAAGTTDDNAWNVAPPGALAPDAASTYTKHTVNIAQFYEQFITFPAVKDILTNYLVWPIFGNGGRQRKA